MSREMQCEQGKEAFTVSAENKKKKGFLSRLLLTYLVAALIPLFCIIGILFQWKWNAGKREMQSTVEYTAELLSTQLESIWNTMSFISLDIVSHESFVTSATSLTYRNLSSYEKSRCYNSLVEAISSYPYVSSSYRVTFFNEEGYFMTNEAYNRPYNYIYRLPEGSLEQYDWIRTAQNNYGKEILLPVSEQILPNTETAGFSLARSVRNPGNVVGFLAVQLTGENLSSLLSVGELYGIDIMISRDGEMIYKSGNFPLGEEARVIDMDSLIPSLRGDYLVTTICKDDSHIQVTAVMAVETVLKEQRTDFILIGIIGLSVTLLTLAMICIFAHKMSAPLILFTRKMQDTTVQNLTEDSDDRKKTPFHEVQLLYDEFFRMRRRLEQMMENEIALTTLQTKERLHYLQAQINPHFLYNTLNMIGIMGADSGDQRIYNSCRMLSAVLKYAITEKESNTATFGEEFHNTEMYLNLMKLRFEDNLEYVTECDPAIRELRTLRITLQPFVENIFEHAFDAEHTKLEILVKGYMREGRWCLIIRDNGAGMPDRELCAMKGEIDRRIRQAAILETPVREDTHIGLRNTLIRMSLFYGDTFRYSMDNVSGGGFQVILEGGTERDARDSGKQA